jgi:hypothetical protein
VRLDIAVHSWRRGEDLPDSVPLPPHAHAEITALHVPDADVVALVAELARRPSFTFRAGRVQRTIAWSERERRFITIAQETP